MDTKEFEKIMLEIEEAYKKNDIPAVNRLNKMLIEGIGVEVNSSALDYEFIESIRNKTVFRSLKKFIKEEKSSVDDALKLMSSIVTHLIIECNTRKREYNEHPIKVVLGMIGEVVEGGEVNEDTKEFFRDRYQRFI